MTQDAMKWLQEVRRLDGALLADMGVKAVDHPSLGHAAAFPYRRSGDGYAAKFRAPDRKDWRSTQGVSRGLYNADCLLSGNTPVVITEGEIDALSCMQAGYLRAVSLPDGWTEDAGKRDVLVESEALLRCAPYVIVAGDNDTAGSSLPRTVANILEGMDVRRADWPDGCKDANDVLVAFGEGRLAECLTSAKRVDPAGGFITGITDLPPLPERRVLRAGMRPYDHVVAFEVGTMSVITGTPGSGKSTFTTFAAFHVAQNEQMRVGLLAFETHPYRIRDHLSRLYAKRPWADLSDAQRRETGQFLDHHFRIVHRRFDETEHHLEWLRQMVYALAVRDGCKLVIVDPWNELEHLPETGESMTAYINFALQRIRSWAEQYDCHICVVAHPRKMPTDGKPRLPTGYDIADSAAFFNKPALGLSVHQESDGDDEWVTVAAWKVRETQLYGFKTGSIRLRFHEHGMTYTQFESDRQFQVSKGGGMIPRRPITLAPLPVSIPPAEASSARSTTAPTPTLRRGPRPTAATTPRGPPCGTASASRQSTRPRSATTGCVRGSSTRRPGNTGGGTDGENESREATGGGTQAVGAHDVWRLSAGGVHRSSKACRRSPVRRHLSAATEWRPHR